MLLLALALIFIVGPLVELYVIIQVAQVIGGWETLGLLLVEGFIGAWLMKRQGRRTLGRIQTQLSASHMPATELVDGGLILLAGALMVAPGFVGDILGFLLLIPPSRAVFRAALMRHFSKRLGTGYAFLGNFTNRSDGAQPNDVFDTTGREQASRAELPRNPT